MKEDLLRFKNDQKYLIFDFETCSLNLGSLDNKPWQLGFLLCKGRNVVEKFDYLIKWDDLKISKEAREITKFSDAKYKSKSVDPNFVLAKFEEYLYNPDYLVLGHNILGFDVYIHGIFRKNLKKKVDYSYLDRCVDTLSLAKAIKINNTPDRNDLISWQFKLNSYFERRMGCSIQALCKHYDIAFDPSKLHNALYDIYLNFQIFQKQLWELEV